MGYLTPKFTTLTPTCPTLQPENRFSATTSRMYFLRGDDTARSETGLVHQTVQIVASHDLTLGVRCGLDQQVRELIRNSSSPLFFL